MEDDVKWVTIRGNHVPLKAGETITQAFARLKEYNAKNARMSGPEKYNFQIPVLNQVVKPNDYKDSVNVAYVKPSKIYDDRTYYVSKIEGDAKKIVTISAYDPDEYEVSELYVGVDEGKVKYVRKKDADYSNSYDTFKYKYDVMRAKAFVTEELQILSKYDDDTIRRLAANKTDYDNDEANAYTVNNYKIDTTQDIDKLRYKLALNYAKVEHFGYNSKGTVLEKKGANLPDYHGTLDKESKSFITSDGKAITMLDKKTYNQLTTNCANQLDADKKASRLVNSYMNAFSTLNSADLNRVSSNLYLNESKHGSKWLTNFKPENFMSQREYDTKINELIDMRNKFAKEGKSVDTEMHALGYRWLSDFIPNLHYHQENDVTIYDKLDTNVSKARISDAKKVYDEYQKYNDLCDKASKAYDVLYDQYKEGKYTYEEIRNKHEASDEVKLKNGQSVVYRQQLKAYAEKYKLSDVDKVDFSKDNTFNYEFTAIRDRMIIDAFYDEKTRVFNPWDEESQSKHGIDYLNAKELYDLEKQGLLNHDIQYKDVVRSYSSNAADIGQDTVENVKRFNDIVDKYGVALDHDVLLFRRTGMDSDQITTGFTQYGVMSCSAFDSLPKKMPSGVSFGDNAMYIIVPAGQKMLFVEKAYKYDEKDKEEVSNARRLARQHEVLLPMGTTLTYTGSNFDNYISYGHIDYFYGMEVKKDANGYR